MTDYKEGSKQEESLINTTTDDLIMRLGQQLVDMINKDKIITLLTKTNKTLGEARLTLASEVDKLKAKEDKVPALEKHYKDKIERLITDAKSTKEAHEGSIQDLKGNHRENLASVQKLVKQATDENSSLSEEITRLNNKVAVLTLELQALKDKEIPSNGASRVVKTKPKKQGRKYTKKAAKTTASA